MFTRNALFGLAGLVLLAAVTVALVQCNPPAQPVSAGPQNPAAASESPKPPAAKPAAVKPAATQPAPPAKPKGQLLSQPRKGEDGYSLYLPANYRADRQWPLLIVGSIPGVRVFSQTPSISDEVQLAADKNGWLVLSLITERRPDAPHVPFDRTRQDFRSADGALAEVLNKWSVDRRRLFLSAARAVSCDSAAAWTIAQPDRLAGLILELDKGPPPIDPLKRAGRPNLPPVLVTYPPAGQTDANINGVKSWLANAGFARVRAQPAAAQDELAAIAQFVQENHK